MQPLSVSGSPVTISQMLELEKKPEFRAWAGEALIKKIHKYGELIPFFEQQKPELERIDPKTGKRVSIVQRIPRLFTSYRAQILTDLRARFHLASEDLVPCVDE